MKSYLLVLKTLHGDPGENTTVVLTGSDGKTAKTPLGKSQSHRKTFKENQTDLFLLLADVDVGRIRRIEFHANPNVKVKDWKYTHVFVVDGVRVYRDVVGTHRLASTAESPSVVDIAESHSDSQDSVYYAFVKTGYDSCSKGCVPTLSLFGSDGERTDTRLVTPSANNHTPLGKHQLDVFRWQDRAIGNIERIQLQLHADGKQSKSPWSVEWMLIVQHGYSFTGRIVLNRTIKPERCLSIDLEQRTCPASGEYGDASAAASLLCKQANAVTEDIGRYYVIVRNLEGTSGNVYLNFHGDQQSTSGELRLVKCENYSEYPFGTKHADLFHLKAPEVGHIRSASMRLDQTAEEHSLTLDSLFVIHNAVLYHFEINGIVLNKQQPMKEFTPRSPHVAAQGNAVYYVATHTADRLLSGTNTSLQLCVTGTNGMFGPVELRESLTNGSDPFERECIDLFYIEEKDIGDPVSLSITLEPKGFMDNLFSGATFERIILVKDGEYNSHWQPVGALKSRETKVIPLPARPRHSLKDTTRTSIVSIAPVHEKPTVIESAPPNPSPETRLSDTKLTVQKTQRVASSPDVQHDDLMTEIEDHQKRHTFAPSLQEAEQNYRELRRLLKKMNAPNSKGIKTRIAQKQMAISTKRNT